MFDTLRNTFGTGQTAVVIILVLCAMSVALTAASIALAFRLSGLSRRLAAMTRGQSTASLEEMLIDYLTRVETAERRIDAVESAVGVLQAQLPTCIQRVNMVRYDAFEDVGGQQSFAIALMDGAGNGVVLTSIYSRSDIRVYSKSIKNGSASHALSKEEETALRGAM